MVMKSLSLSMHNKKFVGLVFNSDCLSFTIGLAQLLLASELVAGNPKDQTGPSFI